MSQKIAHIALLVTDYDEAIEFYTQKLGFTVLEDTTLSETKRWVLLKDCTSVTCCWQKLPMTNSGVAWETSRGEGYFYFFTPTTLSATTSRFSIMGYVLFVNLP